MKTHPQIMTITIIPTRKLVAVVVESVTHALPEGTTDVNPFDAVQPFVPFKEYALGYAGPADRTTVLVERINRGEPLKAADERLAKRLEAFNAGEPS